jgi:Tol biopolymer transport system component
LIGQTLSHYRITAALGAGGMGEVYRAEDATLSRDVAIKLLPEAFASDPERLARFEREARLLASLNHPNVASIHGFEEDAGRRFLVLELVEGEDLAQRLTRGPLPVPEALEVARQIAEALEEAHAKGIVHRDLKPGNVKLTPEGRVKVLDFGLAKAWAGDPTGVDSAADVSQSPTLAHPGTQVGVILGTAAYMSPEQARGRPVDRRADVWAFGVVLFEMLVGERPFKGETPSDILASVLKTDPDWSRLPADTPAGVRALLRRCLQRDPRRRLHDVADARLEIEEILAGGADAPSAGVSAPARAHHARWALAWVVTAALAAAGGALLSRSAGASRSHGAMRVEVNPPEGQEFASDNVARGAGPILSPDGTLLAWVAADTTGVAKLFVRRIDQAEPHALPGTDQAEHLFWSPDSRSVGFFARGRLWTVDVEGKPAASLCDAVSPRGGTWSAEGVILYAPFYTGGLYRVPASGGECTRVTDAEGTAQGQPEFLPDGRHFLFRSRQGLWVGSLDGGEPRVLVPSHSAARFASGYLLYETGGDLVARRLDLERLELEGEPKLLAEGVRIDALTGYAYFSASRDGLLCYLTGDYFPERVLRWVDRSGTTLGTLGDIAPYYDVSLSPDDSRAAVTILDDEARGSVWAYDVARGLRTRLTFAPVWAGLAAWFPDSRSLAYLAISPGGGADVHRRAVDGTEDATPLIAAEGEQRPYDVSRDGSWLSFTQFGEGTRQDLWLLPLQPAGEPRPLLQSPYDETAGRFSPSGPWIAYESDESRRPEVYVMGFPEPGHKQQVSSGGGVKPFWRGDGAELFYTTLDGWLMGVPVASSGEELAFGDPQRLFRTERANIWRLVTAAADGQRFLVATRQAPPPPALQLIVDWPSLVGGAKE